jgi:hypothetical protein
MMSKMSTLPSFESERERLEKQRLSTKQAWNILSILLAITRALPMHNPNNAGATGADLEWITKASDLLFCLFSGE